MPDLPQGSISCYLLYVLLGEVLSLREELDSQDET